MLFLRKLSGVVKPQGKHTMKCEYDGEYVTIDYDNGTKVGVLVDINDDEALTQLTNVIVGDK